VDSNPEEESRDAPQAHNQQQQQPQALTVNEAVLQVQELVAQLQLLVCAGDP
jgi:hypothetical protein